jgi:uncharacterized protein YyaL (SSP411 family)
MTSAEGEPTAYICENFRCAAPAVGVADMKKRLEEIERKED